MTKISLTQGRTAFIDNEDFEKVGQYKWHYEHGYARRDIDKKKRQYMHHLIMGDKQIDHINGSGLDNRRINLRQSTQTENSYNHRKNKNNTSGYKGVSWHNQSGRWRSYISPGRKMISLGLFKLKTEAARAYNIAAKMYFGRFARTNEL